MLLYILNIIVRASKKEKVSKSYRAIVRTVVDRGRNNICISESQTVSTEEELVILDEE